MKIENYKPQIGRMMFILLVALTFAFGARAQTVPPLINYQGKLTDQNGNPLSAGVYGIQFRIWDSATAAGTNDLIWAQQQNATVQPNGVFNVILGSPGGTSIAGITPAVNNLAYAFNGSNCFLGVTLAVSNGVPLTLPNEIAPRQQLMSVPFAIQAQNASEASSLITNLSYALCPAGSIIAFGGTNIPNGWLLCNGSALSRTNFPNLFSAIGTMWGNGDGASTFNLPDMRGIFLRGVNGVRNDAFADPDAIALRTNLFSGGNNGNAVGSYQMDMFASHNHGSGYFRSGGGLQAQQGTGALGNLSPQSSDVAGGNETRPKNAYVYYIIKY